MRLKDNILECVAFICVQRTIEGVARYESIGTAFFMSVDSKTLPHVAYVYLVTAKHLVDGGEQLYLRMNTIGGAFELIRLDANWLFSQDQSVDLAVLPFAPDKQIFEYKTADCTMLATESKLAEHSIGIGEEIAIPGLFVARAGNKRNIPIVRFGNIAAMPVETLTDKKGQEYHAYLVEVRSIGGLSGSPVFAYLGPSRINPPKGNIDLGHWFIFLLGVIRGHWSQPKPKHKINALADDAENVNMGIAVVTPATELEAIIYGDFLTKGRARRDQELILESAEAIKEDSSILKD